MKEAGNAARQPISGKITNLFLQQLLTETVTSDSHYIRVSESHYNYALQYHIAVVKVTNNRGGSLQIF